MTRIVFLDRDTIGPTVQLNHPSHKHEWIAYDRSTPNEAIERLQSADIAITNKVPIRSEAFSKLPCLKMIAVAATGYDVIDIAACAERGITVSNVRGYAVNTVPEHAFALIFALRRNLMGYRIRRDARQMARERPILLFLARNSRPVRISTWHYRRGRNRTGGRRHWSRVGNGCSLCRPQGR